VLIIFQNSIMLRCIMLRTVILMLSPARLVRRLSLLARRRGLSLARTAPSTEILVGAVMYYAVLAMALFAGIDMPGLVLTAAYALPVIAYSIHLTGKLLAASPRKSAPAAAAPRAA
jgi:hypothetical protein